MSRRRLLLFVSLAIGGFALLAIYAALNLLTIERAIRNNTGENMLWAAANADREVQRLNLAVARLTAGDGTLDAARRRLDLVFSRLSLMNDAPQAAFYARIGAGPALGEAARAMDRIDVLLNGAPTPAELAEISAALDRITLSLGKVANDAMIAERIDQGQAHDAQNDISRLLILAFVGMTLAGAALSALLVGNLTALLRSRAALIAHRDRLEETVAERTAALHEALANEKERAEVYRGFLNTVAHQFHTPLAIIDIVAQRLDRHAALLTPEAIIPKAGRIRQAVQRLNGLIGSIVGAANQDSGTDPVLRGSHDLNAIVASAVAQASEDAPDREIALTLAPGPLACNCDPTLIEQILLNLLSNALKFSSRKVTVASFAADGQVGCTVTDHGIGIPEADQAAIFRRFSRASNALRIPGTGLGLNLSRTLAQLHGGELTLRSALGQGSVFTLTLPEEAS